MTESVRIKNDVLLSADTTEDDSDKSFTVPAGEEWELLTVRAELIASATVGNRRMVVEVQDGSTNVLMRIQADLLQTASQTIKYNFAPGLADQSTAVNGDLNSAMPRLRLRPGDVLRVYDIGAIDAAADDLVMRATMLRREA